MMIWVFLSMIASALLAWGLGILLCKQATTLHLLQAPNLRSSHEKPTPTAGGAGIVLAGSVTGLGLFGLYGELPNWWVILGLGILLAGVGFYDDMYHVPARIRLSVQAIVVLGLLMVLGHLPDVVFSVTHLANWVFLGLLLLLGVWWINLFNFMDGIDGIAGVQAIFMLVCAAVLAIFSHPNHLMDEPAWALMWCIVAAVLGFLSLNWPPAKVFMGDVGSTWLGFLILALMLIAVQKTWLNYSACAVLGGVFVVDATITLLTRLMRGERWYEAHRSHAYQRLARRWCRKGRHIGHRSVTLLVVMINLLWLAPWAWVCLRWPGYAFFAALIAYIPLVLAVLWAGAGKPDRDIAL